MKIVVRPLLGIQERKKWVIILEEPKIIRYHLELDRTRGLTAQIAERPGILTTTHPLFSMDYRPAREWSRLDGLLTE